MLAVVSHDAGGAEVVSSYVLLHKPKCLFVLDGPAQAIFKRKLGSIEICGLHEAVNTATSIFCGTSWQSDLEFQAIRMAKAINKHSVVFLDHWVNYRDRFVRLGETCLPDKILVGDSTARDIALRCLAEVPIELVENPYFKEIKRALVVENSARPVKSSNFELSILYVCEPIRDHGLLRFDNATYMGYVEDDALRYFLSNVGSVGSQIKNILIRPHPMEAAGKYAWAAKEYDLPITYGGARSLIAEIATNDIIVGCNSMALVVGLIAGKRVISCIPPGGVPCVLPYSEIESLERIVADKLGAGAL